jgi:hypothetical protein
MLWHKYRELGQILAQAIVLFSLSIFKNALMLAHTLIMREVYNKYVPLRDIAASVSLRRSPILSLYSVKSYHIQLFSKTCKRFTTFMEMWAWNIGSSAFK